MRLILMKQFTHLFFFAILLFSSSTYANDLKNNTSPYLAMHGDDPVNWMQWNKATLEKA
ncbi:MAG: DUF255 domain-containing protein, partial [Cocleimonas sp.]|nr:DUF255 domain-containing protein [Cocleimonas sp.]